MQPSLLHKHSGPSSWLRRMGGFLVAITAVCALAGAARAVDYPDPTNPTGTSPTALAKTDFDIRLWQKRGNDWVIINATTAETFFNRARCLCDEPVRVQVRLTATGLAKARNSRRAELKLRAGDQTCVCTGAACATINCKDLDSPRDINGLINGGLDFDTTVRAVFEAGRPASAAGTACNRDETQNLWLWMDSAEDADADTDLTDVNYSIRLDGVPPQAPTGLRVTPGNEALEVSWEPLGYLDDLQGYIVFCSRAGDLDVFPGQYSPLYSTPASLCPERTVESLVDVSSENVSSENVSADDPAAKDNANEGQRGSAATEDPRARSALHLQRHHHLDAQATDLPAAKRHALRDRGGLGRQAQQREPDRKRRPADPDPHPRLLPELPGRGRPGRGRLLRGGPRSRRHGRPLAGHRPGRPARLAGPPAQPEAPVTTHRTLLRLALMPRRCCCSDRGPPGPRPSCAPTPRRTVARSGSCSSCASAPIRPTWTASSAAPARQPHREFFGPKQRLMTQIEIDYQLFQGFGSAAVGLSLGYFRENANAFAEPLPGERATERTGDNSRLSLYPVALLGIYRADQMWRRMRIPLIPYVKVGLNYTFWSVFDGNDKVAESPAPKGRGRGGTRGWQAAAGLSLVLNVVDPGAARELDAETGINNTQVFFEAARFEVSGLGQKNRLQVGDSTWLMGLGFEF